MAQCRPARPHRRRCRTARGGRTRRPCAGRTRAIARRQCGDRAVARTGPPDRPDRGRGGRHRAGGIGTRPDRRRAPRRIAPCGDGDAGDRPARRCGVGGARPSGTYAVAASSRPVGEVAQARLLARIAPATRCIAIADDAGGILPALARRIATVEIAVPPLAAREGDALLLARHFARVAAGRYGRPVPGFTAAAEARILSGPWADEVRGLGVAVERAILLGDGDMIDATLLAPAPVVAAAEAPAARFDLDENERAVIEAALREHRHNVSHAAAALGLSRGALYRRMARHGL
ncbi:helix-turn-helix domain-containing protein (plasmid) [Sphingomonas panni]